MNKKISVKDNSFQERLKSGLDNLPQPDIQGVDWDKIERNVFAAIDPAVTTEAFGFGHSFIKLFKSHPVRLSFASALVLIVLSGGITYWYSVNQSQSASARLVVVSGTVLHDFGRNTGTDSWTPARIFDRLRAGQIFKTDSSSYLVARINSGSLFSLSSKTEAAISFLDKNAVRLQLAYGSLSVKRCAESRDKGVIVETNDLFCEAKVTFFKVEAENNRPTLISIFHGSVRIGRFETDPAAKEVSAPAQITVLPDSIEIRSGLPLPNTVRGLLDTLALASSSTVERPIGSSEFFLVFSEPPQAQVLFDGVVAGTTPIILEGSRGSHDIVLYKPGFKRAEQKIAVNSAGQSSFFMQLEPEHDSTATTSSIPIGLEPEISPLQPLSTQGLFAGPGAPAVPSSVVLPSLGSIASIENPDLSVQGEKTKYQVAGTLSGKTFYWGAKGFLPDTLGWRLAAGKAGIREESGVPVQKQMARAVSQKRSVYEIKNGSALIVSLFVKMGYKVLLLSQWSGAILQDRTDQRSTHEQPTALTDFLWEPVDSARIVPPSPLAADFSIAFWCGDGRYSYYKGKDGLVHTQSQILGTNGFALADPGRDLEPGANQYRLIVRLYLVSPSEKTGKDIITGLERAMDSLRLDLSYLPPQLQPVMP